MPYKCSSPNTYHLNILIHFPISEQQYQPIPSPKALPIVHAFPYKSSSPPETWTAELTHCTTPAKSSAESHCQLVTVSSSPHTSDSTLIPSNNEDTSIKATISRPLKQQQQQQDKGQIRYQTIMPAKDHQLQKQKCHCCHHVIILKLKAV